MIVELSGQRPGVKGDLTRARIKQCARELFARYGLERVTIRDIAKHAGQRNGGSVNYYFRSKEDLIREILQDAALEADEARQRLLDDFLGTGQAPTVRAILKLMVSSEGQPDDEPIRLISTLMNDRRDMMHNSVPGRLDAGFQRCIEQLRPLLPPMPEAVFLRRMYLTINYLWSVLAKREEGETRGAFWDRFYADPACIETLFDTAEGMLLQPVGQDTQAALDAGGGHPCYG